MKITEIIVSELGGHEEQEDRYCFTKSTKFLSGIEYVFCGVYDGHGGDFTSQYLKENLEKLFFKHLKEGKNINDAFLKSYEECANFLENEITGSTAVNFFLKNGIIHYSYVGDSRLIVVSDDAVMQLTNDHTIDNPSEKERILSLGSKIEHPYLMRGKFGIMVTRSMGDKIFRSVGVISNPETGEYKLQQNDKWILVGSDGVFELSNEEIASILRNSSDIKDAKKKIIHALKDCSDNFTFILINIQSY